MSKHVVARIIDAFLIDEAILLVDPNGNTHHCGPARTPDITIRLVRDLPLVRLLFRPQIAFGEAYVRGDLVVEQGTLRALMALVTRHQRIYSMERWPRTSRLATRVLSAGAWIGQRNRRTTAAGNVRHHYDVGNEFFELLLDPNLQYTCAHFEADTLPQGTAQALATYLEDAEHDLAAAQRERIHRIIRKLCIQPHMRILDIGCGWGGLALAIARLTGARVTGISLSQRQIDYARTAACAEGLSHLVRFELMDYRDLPGQFDRAIAAGVMEHVGKAGFGTFFRTIERILAPDGVALLDFAGRVDGPGATNPWLRKYVYPGGYIPSLTEMTRACEQTRLMLHDVEIARMHYALTVREWSRRLAASAREIRRLKGEHFFRMYELYLAASEMSFVYGRFVNYQLLVSNSRFSTPITRAHMEITNTPMTTGSQPETLVFPRASQ